FVTGTTQGYLANAGKSHRTGLELESQYKLTGAWTLKGSASWIDARFDDYVDANNNINYDRKKVFGVPEYSYNLGVDYREKIAEDWTLFGYSGVTGYGPQYFDNGNEVRQAAYELVDLRLGVEWKSLTCSLWAKNVFDEHYIAYENTTAGFAEDGRPRTFGATLSYAF
ncbi:MAG: TonB-dependent receptor, partial [Pseudodesulfovibrio sp.]